MKVDEKGLEAAVEALRAAGMKREGSSRLTLGTVIATDLARAAITAYEAAKTADGAVAWRDMSTAPRDGTRFLATGGGLGADIDIVSYSERVGCWNATNFTLDDTDHEPEGYNRPSRWQPLPPPQVP